MEGKGLEAFESFKAWDSAACTYWGGPWGTVGFSRRVGTLGELEWKAEGILKLRTVLVRRSSPAHFLKK